MEFVDYNNNDIGFHYSTEEQWTGKYWIDGKKIYTKAIYINQTHPNTEEIIITHNSEIDYIINYYGTGVVAHQSNRRHFPYLSVEDNTGFYMVEFNSSTITFHSNWHVNGYVIIEYTKF